MMCEVIMKYSSLHWQGIVFYMSF